MTKKDSSLLNSNYVPMIGCFVAGFVVNRLMNHQDVVTGDVEEGMNKGDHKDLAKWIMLCTFIPLLFGAWIGETHPNKAIILWTVLCPAIFLLGFVWYIWADKGWKGGVSTLGACIGIWVAVEVVVYKMNK